MDGDAAEDIKALLQGVQDEIASLHETYLKARDICQGSHMPCNWTGLWSANYLRVHG